MTDVEMGIAQPTKLVEFGVTARDAFVEPLVKRGFDDVRREPHE
ncbi:hypothetical protein [Microbacterium wangruii]|nr:hypothetical protein [Microbacterium sp. zg-Y1211]MDL5488169.1 hypothetical protein [Microbacterium sp. zg-Y1211]